jgi:predicted SAM-dependent methyltransferase
VLHVGAGGDPLHEVFAGCAEVRVDINPQHRPDIVASATELGEIGTFDRIYCSHMLEHLYPYDVPRALAEFHRVLVPGGQVLLIVPDLEDVRPTEDVLYVSPSAGPITGLDLIYGVPRIMATMPHMAHHSGFTRDLLHRALVAAGFGPVLVRRAAHYNLIAVGVRG